MEETASIVKYRTLCRELYKTAEPIEMSFGMCTRVGLRKHVLDGGAHRRHLANTIEPSMYFKSDPVSTGMGDRLRWINHFSTASYPQRDWK